MTPANVAQHDSSCKSHSLNIEFYHFFHIFNPCYWYRVALCCYGTLLYSSRRSCLWPDGKDVRTRGGGEKATTDLSLPIHRAALVQSHDSVGSVTSVCSHSSRQKVYRPPSLFKQPTGPELHKGPRGRSTTAPANPHSSYRQENISELVFSMPSTESYMSNMTMSKQRWHIYELMCLEVSKTFTEDEMEWKTW